MAWRDARIPRIDPERLSRPLRFADGAANLIADRMNAAVPWLWWPLAAPSPRERLGAGENALYAAHALVLYGLARRAGLRVPAGRATTLGAASWLWFTGAWDRRAERLRGGSSAQSLR